MAYDTQYWTAPVFMNTIWQNAVSIFYIRPETLYHLWGEGREETEVGEVRDMPLQAAVISNLARHEVCDVWMLAHLLACRLVYVDALYGS